MQPSTILQSASTITTADLRSSPPSSQRRGSTPIVQRLERVVTSLSRKDSHSVELASPRTPRTPRTPHTDSVNAPSPPPAAAPPKPPPPDQQGVQLA